MWLYQQSTLYQWSASRDPYGAEVQHGRRLERSVRQAVTSMLRCGGTRACALSLRLNELTFPRRQDHRRLLCPFPAGGVNPGTSTRTSVLPGTVVMTLRLHTFDR